VLVDTRAMNRVIVRNPEDMTVTVQAGSTLYELGRALDLDRQRLALDAEEPQRATLGGLVAANAGGGLAYGFGLPRDLVLGMTVVDGSGRTLRLGGRVVKNVAGYDLVRIFTGSFGTLGVITELTLRTHPAPELAMTVDARFPRARDVESARAAIFHSELPLAAFDMEVDTSGPVSRWTLVLRLEGTRAEAAYQAHRCIDLCAGGVTTESSEWHSPFGRRRHENVAVRSAQLPDRIVAYVERLSTELGRPHRIAARLGDGAVRVFASTEKEDDARAIVTAVRRVASVHGSNAVIECLPAPLKASIDAWGDPPEGFALMRGLKKGFDPDGVLARGRFIGGL
jgi:glycolate oxidase FAD binding subunit